MTSEVVVDFGELALHFVAGGEQIREVAFPKGAQKIGRLLFI